MPNRPLTPECLLLARPIVVGNFVCTVLYTAQVGLAIRFYVLAQKRAGGQVFVQLIAASLLVANFAALLAPVYATFTVDSHSHPFSLVFAHCLLHSSRS